MAGTHDSDRREECACIICLESEPSAIQSGCACRSDCGMAHVACLVEKAVSQQAQRGYVVWWACQTCNQQFTGAMQKGLAEAWWSRVRDQPEESAERLFAMGNMADSHLAEGNVAEAERINRNLLVLMRRVLGQEHPATLSAANNLSTCFFKLGNYAESERINCEVLNVQRRVLGEEHPDTMRTAGNLSSSLSEQCKYEEAEKIQRQVLAVMKRKLGQEHPSTLNAAANLAASLSDQGKRTEAEELLEAALKVCRRVLGNAHPNTLAFERSLGNVRSVMRAEQQGGNATAQRNDGPAPQPLTAAFRGAAFLGMFGICAHIFPAYQNELAPLFLIIWAVWRMWALRARRFSGTAL